jgi:hypothetical protein
VHCQCFVVIVADKPPQGDDMTAHPRHLASLAISKELETLTNYTDALCVCLLALFFMCGTWFLGGGGAEKDKTATMERRDDKRCSAKTR